MGGKGRRLIVANNDDVLRSRSGNVGPRFSVFVSVCMTIPFASFSLALTSATSRALA